VKGVGSNLNPEPQTMKPYRYPGGPPRPPSSPCPPARSPSTSPPTQDAGAGAPRKSSRRPQALRRGDLRGELSPSTRCRACVPRRRHGRPWPSRRTRRSGWPPPLAPSRRTAAPVFCSSPSRPQPGWSSRSARPVLWLSASRMACWSPSPIRLSRPLPARMRRGSCPRSRAASASASARGSRRPGSPDPWPRPPRRRRWRPVVR